MSLELRTPLNSRRFILAQQLADNVEGNLHVKQIQFAQTIYSAGSDLLTLINDILDLSKIESGTVTVDPSDLSFTEMRQYVERTFRHMADNKNLDFHVAVDEDLPSYMNTDVKRLQQVIKNLLSNAFKFTERGHVDLRINVARAGWKRTRMMPSTGPATWSPSRSPIRGSGSIPTSSNSSSRPSSRPMEPQAASTWRNGLGQTLDLARNRPTPGRRDQAFEVGPGEGSTFTLYLPLDYKPNPLGKKSDEGQGRLLPPPAEALPRHHVPGSRRRCRNGPAANGRPSAKSGPCRSPSRSPMIASPSRPATRW